LNGFGDYRVENRCSDGGGCRRDALIETGDRDSCVADNSAVVDHYLGEFVQSRPSILASHARGRMVQARDSYHCRTTLLDALDEFGCHGVAPGVGCHDDNVACIDLVIIEECIREPGQPLQPRRKPRTRMQHEPFE
jgi:hypothetical protein